MHSRHYGAAGNNAGDSSIAPLASGESKTQTAINMQTPSAAELSPVVATLYNAVKQLSTSTQLHHLPHANAFVIAQAEFRKHRAQAQLRHLMTPGFTLC